MHGYRGFGVQGVQKTLENHKDVGFFKNTGSDTQSAFKMLGHQQSAKEIPCK